MTGTLGKPFDSHGATARRRPLAPAPRGRLAWLRLLAAGTAIAAAVPAPAWAQGMIRFTHLSSHVSGYLALPEGAGTHAALVVIHEWWGLNDWVKAQADSLAAHGYVAFAPDLYQGKVAADAETAHQLMSGLAEDQALTLLRTSAEWLRSREDVRAQAVGTIGWCMGGRYAIRLAAADPGLRACVMYYGAPITDPAAIRGIQAAVLGNFGGEDQGPSPKQVRSFEAALRKAGKRVDFKIYPGAGHAFANEKNPWGGYRKVAARDAWKRTLAFLNTELKRASRPRGVTY